MGWRLNIPGLRRYDPPGAASWQGGAGADTVDGGWGSDVVSGGSDADLFVWRADSGDTDRFTDFVRGTDLMVLGYSWNEPSLFDQLDSTNDNRLTAADLNVDVIAGNLVLDAGALEGDPGGSTLTVVGVTQLTLADLFIGDLF